MYSLISFLTSLCQAAIQDAFPQLTNIHPDITQSTKEHFGHYQCNDAMKLAKELKKSPRSIAEEIVVHLPKQYFSSIEIAGAGFINFTFSKEFLSQQLTSLFENLQQACLTSSPQKIIVDFSSPNIAKEMHVGHLRSTIIGDCLARIFKFVGHDVLCLNHIGDWGTAFGMLITFLQDNPQSYTQLDDLTELYKQAHKQFADDPEFKKRAQLNVVALQSGDPEALQIWKQICEVSEHAFKQIYDTLDVQIQTRGESFYNPFLKNVIEDLETKGLLTSSDGAKCVFHEFSSVPFIVQKSDGGYNYATTDLAAMRYRSEVDRADKILIVTDLGQALHFRLLAATALLAGYLKHEEAFSHVGFGLVLDAQGKKFKTRSGENIKLKELLTTAVEQAKSVLQQHRPDLSEQDLEKQAPIIGINAIKYADLSSHRTHDYIFSFEKMLRFEGNTAMFLLYAYVRIQGIKRKIQSSQLEVSKNLQIDEPAEELLALGLLRFPEILTKTMNDLCPHILTDYLYDLTSKFNAFFRDCRIEGSSAQESRLSLCACTERILKIGMHLLGLKTLEKL